MEKERPGTKARGVVLFWGEAPKKQNTGNPKFRLRGVWWWEYYAECSKNQTAITRECGCVGAL